MTHQFSPKDPIESVPVVFDFAALASSVTSAAITVSTKSGVDANPNAIKSGLPVISGATVTQRIASGVLGVTYAIRCIATTPVGDFVEVGIMTVQSAEST